MGNEKPASVWRSSLACEFERLLDSIFGPTNSNHDIMANTQTKSSSFFAQVLDLAPGDSCSRVRPVDPTTSVERLPEELPEIKQQLRNACTPAVTNAKEKTGGTYSIEVGEVVMPKGRMYVLAVVTRNHE